MCSVSFMLSCSCSTSRRSRACVEACGKRKLAAGPVTVPAMWLPHTELASLARAASHADLSLDASGILWLEHINMEVGNREQALLYYRDFLGFVEDPSPSFHLNLGSQQLHLAEAPEAHVITGSVGLAVPSLDALRARAPEATTALQGTCFHLTVRLASQRMPIDT